MEETADSDSADDLFLTQAVTSALRTVHSPPDTEEHHFARSPEDEQRTSSDGDPATTSSSDSETGFAELYRKWGSTRKTPARNSHQHRQIKPKILELPYLKKPVSGKVMVQKNNVIVNSEIGGFFKCMQELGKRHGEKSRRELSPSMLFSDSESDDYDDIRKVNIDRFIYGRDKKNCLPLLNRKTRKKTRKCQKDLIESDESSSSCNEEPEKSKKSSTSLPLSQRSSPSIPSDPSSAKSLFAKSLFVDLSEKRIENPPQVLVQCSQSPSLNWHQPQETNKACKNLLNAIDEMAVEETQWPSSNYDEDETQILENEPQEENGKEFGSSGSEDFQCSPDLFEESNDNQLIPSKAEKCLKSHAANKSVLAGGSKFQSSEKISATTEDRRRKEKDKMTLGGVSLAHVPPFIIESRVVLYDIMKHKCMTQDHAKYSRSQMTQTSRTVSPKVEDNQDQEREERDKKAFESFVVLRDIMKDGHDKYLESRRTQTCKSSANITALDQEEGEKDKRTADDLSVEHASSSIFKSFVVLRDIINDNRAKYSESLITRSMEIFPTAGDEQQETDKEISDDLGVERVQSSSPLKDSTPENHYASPVKKMDSPLFNYGGMTLLKRKKGQKTEPSGNANNLPPKKAALDLNEGFPLRSTDATKSGNVKMDGLSENQSDPLPDKPRKKSKKVINEGLLELFVDAKNGGLPEMRVSSSPVQSVQDISVVCPFVSEKKPKKKRKKDKHCKPSPDGDQGSGEGHGSASLSSITEETKHLTGNDYSSHEVNPLDSHTQAHGDFEKKKKMKERIPSPRMAETLLGSRSDKEISVSAYSSLSVQESLVDRVLVGGHKDGLLEEPVSVDTVPPVEKLPVASTLVGGSQQKIKEKRFTKYVWLTEPVDLLPQSITADSTSSVKDSLVGVGSKLKKKRKKDKIVGTLEEPDTVIPTEDISVDCALTGERKPKKKKKKDKNNERLADPINIWQQTSISVDSTWSVQDSIGGSKPKKKRKKDRSAEPEGEAIQSLGQGSSTLVSITEETVQLIGHAINQLDHHVQADGLDGPRRKKKKKEKESRPETTKEIFALHLSEDSSSHAIKTMKKKKQTFIDYVVEGQVEEIPTDCKCFEEPSDKIDTTANVEIQCVNKVHLMSGDSVTSQKKKKKKKKNKRKAVVEENKHVVTPSVAIQEQVLTREIEEETADGVCDKKKVKKKKKEHRETSHEEKADTSLFLEPSPEQTLSIKSETKRTRQVEELVESKSMKKRKEVERDGWMDDTHWSNRMETQLTDDSNKGKKRKRTKSHTCKSTQVLQSDDTILVKRKKKKKQPLVEPDTHIGPEIVEHDNGIPSDISKTGKKKKKKKRKYRDEDYSEII